jgi:hypothetical protein
MISKRYWIELEAGNLPLLATVFLAQASKGFHGIRPFEIGVVYEASSST